jgi:hypothetical protein
MRNCSSQASLLENAMNWHLPELSCFYGRIRNTLELTLSFPKLSWLLGSPTSSTGPCHMYCCTFFCLCILCPAHLVCLTLLFRTLNCFTISNYILYILTLFLQFHIDFSLTSRLPKNVSVFAFK